jgi:hypothetical protein
MRVNAYESASLVTQWITTVATVAAVLVALVFGWLTLANSRRSKDNQDRATYAAATQEPVSAEFAEAVKGVSDVSWQVIHEAGENYILRHTGSISARHVVISGLTLTDQSRLEIKGNVGDVGPTGVVPFVFRSRFSQSGPGNVVVSFQTENSQSQTLSRTVRVPAN